MVGETRALGRRVEEVVEMEVLDRTATVWAVVDASYEVVVIASGADAPEFVEEWTERGFRALPLRVDELSAA
jgi:glycine/D-amino acid oxidase-like deaminating enzyme